MILRRSPSLSLVSCASLRVALKHQDHCKVIKAWFRWGCTQRAFAAAPHLKRSGSSYRASAASTQSKKSKVDNKGASTTEEFHAYFEAQFGDRWPALYAAMARPTSLVALLNPFLGQERLRFLQQELPGSALLPQQLEPWRPAGAVRALQYSPAEEGGGYPPPYRDPTTGLLPWYWLDWASLVPPLALGVAPGQGVLDMCAAPGGKSLVLAQLLFAAEAAAQHSPGGVAQQLGPGSIPSSPGRLMCNELDPGRRRRLLGVLRDYVPQAVREEHLRVTPHDGGTYWRSQEGESFDRILLDAPCSSDRHIVQQAEGRAGARAERGASGGRGEILKADWSVRRCKAIAAEQAKLLTAAVKALKPGGRLVYSTCSIASVENDEAVDRVLERAGSALAVASHALTSGAAAGSSVGADGMAAAAPPTASGAATAGHEWVATADFGAWGAEPTRHGWLLLPDRTGWGPMFVCVLEKLGSSDLRRIKVNKYASTRK